MRWLGMQAVFDALDSTSVGDADVCSGIGEILERIGPQSQTNNVRGTRSAEVHAQKMRTAKLWRQVLRKHSKLSPAVRAAADRCNVRFAVRRADTINLEDPGGKSKLARAQADVGRGAHRRWTPFALLRCCFGVINIGAGRRCPYIV